MTSSASRISIAKPNDLDWRKDRPAEDPEKTKRWGFINAKPSEFLVHVRRGRVTSHSGQGATAFKWPWDSVAVVPTSLQRLHFTADQVTREKIGVEVTGLAVFRIAEPLLAYRLLNFSYPERAQEKLTETLTDMCVGATRRIVASLEVDDCLRKRKAALADELVREIAPVVGGQGRPEDSTEQGWGVVIDTIEIQEVRVLSAKVFASMQAPYRAELDQRAQLARSHAEEATALQEAESKKRVEEARIASDEAVARADADSKKRVEESRIATQSHIAAQRRAVAEKQREAQAQAELRTLALRLEHQKAELEAHELELQALSARAERERTEAAFDEELRRARLELVRAEGHAEAEVARVNAEVALVENEAAAKIALAQNLPELASAVGSRMGEVKVVQYGADANPFAHATGALRSILEMVQGTSAI